MANKSIPIDHVIALCEANAMEFRTAAAGEKNASYTGGRNNEKTIEYEAKALAMDQLINQLRAEQRSNVSQKVGDGIETLAREIAPQAFASYSALVTRLRHEGRDECDVIREAEAAYGTALNDAREKAEKSLKNEMPAGDIQAEAYGYGLADAISWHEHHALQAEKLAANEPIPQKKVIFRQRAARHRLYADTMRDDFEALKSQRIHIATPQSARQVIKASEKSQVDGIPLDVQRAFKRRIGEWLDEA